MVVSMVEGAVFSHSTIDADLGTQREGEIAYMFDECILCTDWLSAMIAILEDWRFLVRSERARDRLAISGGRLDSHVA